MFSSYKFTYLFNKKNTCYILKNYPIYFLATLDVFNLFRYSKLPSTKRFLMTAGQLKCEIKEPLTFNLLEIDMKKLTKTLIGLTSLLALPTMAGQTTFEAGDNRIETQMCVAAAENKLGKYKRMVDSFSSRKNIHSIIANKLTCNSQPIANFAYSYNADKTAEFLSNFSKHRITIKREVSSMQSSNRKIIVTAD